MEISQSNSLGDLAALLQMPLQASHLQNPVPGKVAEANSGGAFSQIMQQLNGTGTTFEGMLSSADAELLPALQAVHEPTAIHEPLTTFTAVPPVPGGKTLPLERQGVADASPELSMPGDVQIASLNDSPRLNIPADQPVSTLKVGSEAGTLVEPLRSTGKPQDLLSEPPLRAEPTSVVKPEQQPVEQKQANADAFSSALREREALNPQSNLTELNGKLQTDTAPAMKMALPVDLQKKMTRQEEGASNVHRTVEGLSALNMSRTSSATPTLESAMPQGFTEKSVADAFTEKVVWMTGQGAQRANLQLNPAELGALQIRVTMIENSAQVEIHAQNADTGELLETLLPRLQSALEQQGVKVEELKLNANALFAESGEERSSHAQTSQDNTSQKASESGETETVSVTEVSSSEPGRVDYYA